MLALRESTIGQYIDAVSSSAPTPAGGSVAAAVAALGARLGSIVPAIPASKSADDRIGESATDRVSFRGAFLRLSMQDRFDSVTVQLENDGRVRSQRIVDQVVDCIRE